MNVGWAERLRVVLQSSLRVLGWLLPVGERLLLLLLAWLGLELLGKLRGEILHIRLLLHEVADLHVAWVERLLVGVRLRHGLFGIDARILLQVLQLLLHEVSNLHVARVEGLLIGK